MERISFEQLIKVEYRETHMETKREEAAISEPCPLKEMNKQQLNHLINEHHNIIPETGKQFKFEPPLFLQRYDYVRDLLLEYNCKSLMDIGTAECRLPIYLKNTNQDLNLIIGLDINGTVLEGCAEKFSYPSFDAAHPRPNPLDVFVLKGDICKPSEYFLNQACFKNTQLDCVSMIELLEHLNPYHVNKCIESVFKYLKPNLIVMTTPNNDFNVVFEDLEHLKHIGGVNQKHRFRHLDHKFEWTRQEFKDWCQSILSQYPEYELVKYDGLGEAPLNHKDAGFCSQIALFKKRQFVDFAHQTYHYIERTDKFFDQQEFNKENINKSDEEKFKLITSFHVKSASTEPCPLKEMNKQQLNHLINEHHNIIPETGKQFKFEPPLFLQRYDYVRDLLLEYNCKSLMDLGTAECRLPIYLKNTNQDLNLIIGLDINESVLQSSVEKFSYPSYDATHPRPNPLDVFILKGDICKPSEYFLKQACFENTQLDCVSMIELLEHLNPYHVNKCIESVFKYLKPNLVVMTTPNNDFNVVFEDLEHLKHIGGANQKHRFRHPDHKFEWTRKEFMDWCQTILNDYPEYELVKYDGLGEAPLNHKESGFCSQIALFKKKHFKISNERNKMSGKNEYFDPEVFARENIYKSENEHFKLIASLHFPFDL